MLYQLLYCTIVAFNFKYKNSIIGARFKIYIASFAFLIKLIFSFDLFEIKTLSKLFSYQILEGLVIPEVSRLELLEGVGVEGTAEV